MRSSVRLLIAAQIAVWLGLAVCVALIPRFLFEYDEGGVSNYGVYSTTIIPYTLAFGLCGLLTLQAARLLSRHTVHRQGLRLLLFLTGWLYLFALESTYLYQVNALLDTAHIVSAVMLFLFETAAALWLGHAFARDRLQNLLLGMQLAGFVLAVLTYLGVLHLLFIAEMVTNLAFGLLLIRVVRQATLDLRS